MSEQEQTPQAVLEQWLAFDEPGLVAAKLRVAIRAVLAQLAKAEAEVTIVSKVDYDMYHLARAVEAEAEAERLRKDTEADSLAITDLEAEVERLRADLSRTLAEAGILTQGITDQHDRAERAEAALGKITGEPDIAKAQGIAHAALRDTAPAAESCPNCNGLGTLDEPHLPGGNCPICRGSGLRDTAHGRILR